MYKNLVSLREIEEIDNSVKYIPNWVWRRSKLSFNYDSCDQFHHVSLPLLQLRNTDRQRQRKEKATKCTISCTQDGTLPIALLRPLLNNFSLASVVLGLSMCVRLPGNLYEYRSLPKHRA